MFGWKSEIDAAKISSCMWSVTHDSGLKALLWIIMGSCTFGSLVPKENIQSDRSRSKMLRFTSKVARKNGKIAENRLHMNSDEVWFIWKSFSSYTWSYLDQSGTKTEKWEVRVNTRKQCNFKVNVQVTVGDSAPQISSCIWSVPHDSWLKALLWINNGLVLIFVFRT